MSIFIFDHMIKTTLDMSEWPMNINILQRKMILKTIILKQTSHRNSRILNQNIQPLPLTLQLPNNPQTNFLNLLKIRHIKLYNPNSLRKSTSLFNTLKLFNITCTNDCMCFKFIKLIYEILANSWWCACYPDDFVFEGRFYEFAF